jgi:hypothetical protein
MQSRVPSGIGADKTNSNGDHPFSNIHCVQNCVMNTVQVTLSRMCDMTQSTCKVTGWPFMHATWMPPVSPVTCAVTVHRGSQACHPHDGLHDFLFCNLCLSWEAGVAHERLQDCVTCNTFMTSFCTRWLPFVSFLAVLTWSIYWTLPMHACTRVRCTEWTAFGPSHSAGTFFPYMLPLIFDSLASAFATLPMQLLNYLLPYYHVHHHKNPPSDPLQHPLHCACRACCVPLQPLHAPRAGGLAGPLNQQPIRLRLLQGPPQSACLHCQSQWPLSSCHPYPLLHRPNWHPEPGSSDTFPSVALWPPSSVQKPLVVHSTTLHSVICS